MPNSNNSPVCVLPRVQVAGIPVVRVTREQFAQQMVADWQAQKEAGRTLLPKMAFSVNGQAIALYHTDAANRAAMNGADYIHADGMPVVFASKWLTSTPIPERCATTDFFHDAAKAAQQTGMAFFFLGGTEDENRLAVAEAQALYPQLKIAGRHNGYWKPDEEAALIEAIKASEADILWINLGKPRQEEFCLKYQAALRGVTWFKTCGGLYKFLAKIDSRAPEWMQKLGLEWLYRMLREPGRLGWRYMTTNVMAIWHLLTKTRSL